jgi:hypothetical protein
VGVKTRSCVAHTRHHTSPRPSPSFVLCWYSASPAVAAWELDAASGETRCGIGDTPEHASRRTKAARTDRPATRL